MQFKLIATAGISMVNLDWLAIYIALGIFVGFMAGLLGIGGGGILVPILVSIFTYQGIAAEHVVHLALGTALACMVITSSASLRAHAKKRTVLWPLAFGLAPGIVLGAFFTGRFAIAINPVVIAVFFAAFMTFIGVQMLFNVQPKSAPQNIKNPLHIGGEVSTKRANQQEGFLHATHERLLGKFTGGKAGKLMFKRLFKISQLMGVGTVIGAVSALATVGGGFLTLSFLTYQNIDIKKAIGTSSAIGLSIAIAGTLGYWATNTAQAINIPGVWGFVHGPAFCVIGISSLLAAPTGVLVASRIEPIYLKRTFALVSFLLGAKMVYAVL